MGDFLNNLNKLWNLDELFSIQNHWSEMAVWGIALAIIVVSALALGWIVRAFIGGLIARLTAKTETLWDDYLFDKAFFRRLGNLLPAIASYALLHVLVTPGQGGTFNDALFKLFAKVMLLWVCISCISFANTIINNFEKGFLAVNGDKRIPVRSYIQMVKLLLFLVAAILIISILFEQNPVGILTGLGALTAVLILVFKDALLGLVASLQLNTNNLVQVGDWIEFPSSNIEGEVIDIALSVVKIKSGDNTVYSLPTYNLVSVPFKNWRNVKEMGARRIKLSFPVDGLVLTIISPEHQAQLQRDGFWKVPKGQITVTNLEAFRYWAQDYLDSHVAIHTEQARIVKIGDPSGRGIPVEMVFYTTITVFPDWELLRSQLYCHFLANLAVFNLKVFQDPVGVVKA